MRATNTGPWEAEHAEPARIEIQGSAITLRHVRNFEYQGPHEFTPAYYDRSFALSDLVSIDLGLSTLADYKFASHTFVSFGLKDGYRFILSVEARKPLGTTYSPMRGLLHTYGLIYVIADERDFLRSVGLKNLDVYIYPIHTTPELVQAAFLSMAARANALQEHPEFYNTFVNSCTVNLFRHLNHISPGRMPWSIRIPLSFGIDQLAHSAGLLRTPLSFPEARLAHHVTARICEAKADAEFSRCVREQPA